ncbi:phage tail tape measure protein [Cytobacillus horneckiae]|uniref:phage tail tape measure protein n=1 Tax=Cytobacillus horneckiae TaxID=549687 RepID=UPI003D2597CC
MAEVGALRINLSLNSADFTQGMRHVNQRLTALNSEFRAITAGSSRFDNSLESLQQQSNVLTRTLSTHQSKVEELRKQYERSAETKGKDAQETVRLATAYNRAVAAMKTTEQQLKNVNKKIQEQSNSFKQLESEVNSNVDNISRKMRVLESSFDASTVGVENFGDSLDSLRQKERHLIQSLELHQRRVEELNRLHLESVRAKGADARETQELEIRLNRARQAMRESESQLNSTTEEISEQTNAWKRLSTAVNQTGDRLQEQGQNMRDIGQSVTVGLTLPIAGFAVAAGKAANSADASVGRIEARLGVTTERAEELGKVANDVWKHGFGNNLQEVGDGITIISNNLKGISDKELKSAANGAFFLSEAFNADVNESTRAAGQLMKDFGDQSDKTFDLITWGFQNGLDYTGEFLDTIREYSPQFSEMGYTSEQFLNSLKSGFDAGAWSLDKIGDSIKESHLRMGALDKATVDAYKSMGLNAEEYVEKISKGGEEGNKAFQTIVKKLMEVDDATERNTLSTALFGTQYEDLREKVIFAVAGASKEIEGLEGTTKKASDALHRDFGARATKVWRDFITDLRPVGDTLLDIAEDVLPKVADVADKVTDSFVNLSPEGQKAAVMIGGLAAAAGPAVVALGLLSSGTGLLLKGIGPLTTAIGAKGLAGSLAALTGPVGITVAALGVTAGAVYKVTSEVKKSREVNLDHAESLIDQQQKLENLSSEYDALREKNKLSNDELLRYRDIQSEMKFAESAEQMKSLTDEQSRLIEKSGLTNKEMDKMISLNDDLIKLVPDVDATLSNHGNAIIGNKDALEKANSKLKENIELELENQRIKAEAKLDENIRKYIESLDELKEKEAERDEAVKARDELEQKSAELRKKAQKELNEGKEFAYALTIDEIGKTEYQLLQQNSKVEKLADEVQEKIKTKDLTQEEIEKTQQLYNQMIDLQLAQVGINEKGDKGLKQLDEAIKKTETRISELNKTKDAQGGLNSEQQKELDNLLAALGMYRTTKGEIKKIQGEQQSVNNKINEGTGKAKDMTGELRKGVKKDVKVDDNGTAKKVTDEAKKKANKSVKASDNGTVDRIDRDAKKEVSKRVKLEAVWSGLETGLNKALKIATSFFAEGTRDAPGGLSVIGEAGRELAHFPGMPGLALVSEPTLLNLPKGSKVIPNRDTEKILRNWNIPMMSTGGITVSDGMAYIAERGRELLDLSGTGAMTVPLPINNTPNNFESRPVQTEVPTQNNYYFTYHSPKPIDPYESSRLAKQALREAALQI